MITYPIKLTATASFINELRCCEEGRYEDALLAREEGRSGYELVLGDFITRHKTRIELHCDAEMTELWYALGAGTIGETRAKQANKLMDLLRERMVVVNPAMVTRFPRAVRF